jgi:hypothetical protein
MLRGQPVHSVVVAGSAPSRSFERRRNEAPPVALWAVPCESRERPCEVGTSSLVASADLGDEPVIDCDPVHVEAAFARAGAHDPLSRPTGFDDDAVMIEETLRGPGHV